MDFRLQTPDFRLNKYPLCCRLMQSNFAIGATGGARDFFYQFYVFKSVIKPNY
jgi:hypothetical protein